jgi:hypothetical protein
MIANATRIALAQVQSNANPQWLDFALACVCACALTRKRFTSDDVDELLDAIPGAPKTHEKRALGPVFLAVKRSGKIIQTNEVKPSNREKLHNSPRRIWLSRVYDAKDQQQQPLFTE